MKYDTIVCEDCISYKKIKKEEIFTLEKYNNHKKNVVDMINDLKANLEISIKENSSFKLI